MKKQILFFLCLCIFHFGFSQLPSIGISSDSASTCKGNTTPIILTATLGSYSGYTSYLNASQNSSNPVTCDCPPGYVAVGYYVRWGQWMDQIKLACKKLNPDGTLDPDVVYTSSGGGNGGEYGNIALFADNNTALTGANLNSSDYGYAATITGYGQPLNKIIAGSDNSYGAVSLNTLGAGSSRNAGSAYAPAGYLITGMKVVIGDDYFVQGISFRYSSINELLKRYTVNWSNGQTGSFISVLPTETTKYTATITNDAGLSASDDQTIEIHPLPAPEISMSGTYFCFGGSSTLSIPNGYASYQWNNGATTSSVRVSQSGSYSVTVGTTNGCRANSSKTIELIAVPNSTDIYVDSSINRSGEGISWRTAFKTLPEAINAANGCTTIKNIWVAKGTYKPAAGNSRDSAFAILRGGLKIFGGYPSGGGTRNTSANPTILSGDIGANNNSDNSYHVLVIAGLSADADSIVLDGFTITGGNANGTSVYTYGSTGTYQGNGGGAYIINNANKGKIALRNLIVNNNRADYVAGGFEINNSSPFIYGCIFANNSNNYNGAGMFNEVSSSPFITNCLFVSNNSSGNGGGIYNLSSSPRITNCTFYANNSNGGSGIYNDYSSSTITNCIIWGNTGNNGGIYSTDNSRPTVTYNLLQDDNEGTGNLNIDPLFVDASNGNLHLQVCSPAIDGGDNSSNSTDKDLGGKPRIAGSTIDLGAYEFQGQSGPASIINMPHPATVCVGTQVKLSVTATGGNISYQWQKDGIDINGATDSVYSIAATASADAGKYKVVVSGCGSPVSSDAVQLTVNTATAPVVTVVNNCGSSTLSTNATGSLLWSTGETTSSITVSKAGNYTVTQTVNGCISEEGSGTAAPKTAPSKPVITANGSTNFCQGGSVVLSAPSGFTSYKWSNNATTLTITVNQSGSYSVAVTNTAGCTSPASDAIIVTVGNDTQKPVVTCPAATTLCYVANETYTIAALQATDNCTIASTAYIITGATSRTGSGSNASGIFKPGTSTITWTVKDGSGNTSTCQSNVTVNEKFTASIPDGWALGSGCTLNTVYIGYTPASYILLVAKPTGGKSPYTYKWSNGSTASYILVNPAAVTTYTLTVKDAKGCTQSSSKQINVVDVRCGSKKDKVTLCYKGTAMCTEQKDVAGYLLKGAYLGNCISKGTASRPGNEMVQKQAPEESELTMKASPNPSTAFFKLSIKSSDIKDRVSISVVDEVGRVVETRTVNAGETIQIGERYRAGVYYAQALQGNKRATVKLIKQAW